MKDLKKKIIATTSQGEDIYINILFCKKKMIWQICHPINHIFSLQ